MTPLTEKRGGSDDRECATMEKLRIGITILGMFIAACVLMLAGGVIEKRTRLNTLATWVGIAILAAMLAFVIYAALVLFS